ncbi:uncharacterized protein LOC123308423 [Coccinella septempunctata]|uniref:uncharacterized protein LOC123308423 n=1 Tax=Coccinella septempunctata TaxID=41139 RepID=UPI001D08290A|nr:uncharacterized protein LOC123308423 [Coccinella septempunctata]
MDTEKLISLVREHPVLYCTTHPYYMRTKYKDELWESLGEKLNADGVTVKEQWQKLRDCHREALRRQNRKKRGPQSDPPRTWIYQQQMEFLLPFMKNSKSYMNEKLSGLSVLPNEGQSEGPANDLYIHKPPNPIKGESSSDDEQKPIISELPQNEQFRTISPIQHVAEHGNELRQDFVQWNTSERDALHDFFMAMYSTTKQLPGSYKRRIKKEIFKIVLESEEEYETTKLS